MQPSTKLHSRLIEDCIPLGEFPLCMLLLLDDSHFPWFILVPKRDGITEIHQLTGDDQKQLLDESIYLSRCLEAVFKPDKLNIAALGNVVPQLHIHHIARFTSDACWPAPVWGAVAATPYAREDIILIRQQLSDCFDSNKIQPFHWNDETGHHDEAD